MGTPVQYPGFPVSYRRTMTWRDHVRHDLTPEQRGRGWKVARNVFGFAEEQPSLWHVRLIVFC